jgi:hypothetical protein
MLSPKELGAGIAVDPGPHEVIVRMAEHVPWTSSFVAAEGKTARILLPSSLAPAPSLTAAEVPPAPPANAPTTPSAPIGASASAPADVTQSSWGAQKTTGVVLGAAGVVGLGVGAYFVMRSIDRRDSSQDHCSGNVCDAQGVRLRNDAMHAGDVATITLIAGAATTTAGAVLFFTAPTPSSSSAPSPPATGGKSLRAEPWVSFSSAGLSVRGAFE